MATRLAEMEERNALVDAASNDGLWDFDFDTNELYLSPRWKAMMGYEDIGPDGDRRLARHGASG